MNDEWFSASEGNNVVALLPMARSCVKPTVCSVLEFIHVEVLPVLPSLVLFGQQSADQAQG